MGPIMLVVAAALLQGGSTERLVGLVRPGRGEGDVHSVLSAKGLRGRMADRRVVVIESDPAVADQARRLRESGVFSAVEVDQRAAIAGRPSDPSYGAQWHLPRVGAETAWAVTWGSADVIVAVIDAGIDASHPEFAGRILPGWNFVKDTADTSDVTGHGTAVAGVVGAAANNGVQGAGLAGGCRILPLVVVGSDGFAWYSDIAAAIMQAADRGARIINVSIGGESASMILQEAVDYAWARGSLVFASAMNEGTTAPRYPAACDKVIAVAATNTRDALATFSNRGAWISLAAPGDAIYTTRRGGGSEVRTGTSFASPLVAGVGALVLSVRPDLDPGELRSLLSASCAYLGAEAGAGMIDAGRAVESALGWQAAAPASSPAAEGSSGGSGGSCSASASGPGRAAWLILLALGGWGVLRRRG